MARGRRDKKTTVRDDVRLLRSAEVGEIVKEAPEPIALVYPSPYRTGMSSLGFQTIYRQINETPGRAAHRAFLPDDLEKYRRTRSQLFTFETGRSVGDYPIIAMSVAYELELAGIIDCLELSGLAPLRRDRDERDPIILAGGPLTFSNPWPLMPFVDAVLIGEADETIGPSLDVLFGAGSKREALEALAREIPSAYVPEISQGALPDTAKSNVLPAYSQIRTPNCELSDMFLVEPERGCHRVCQYCVMRRSTNGGMRKVDKSRVYELIPDEARKVGLVGAAVSDHPQICDMIEELTAQGKRVSLSSLRPDRLNDRFVSALARSGARSLTTASDGASQRLRDEMQRRAKEDHLAKVCELAREHGLERVKIYMMVGLPGETDEDIDELIEFGRGLSKRIPISLGIAPFVAKRNTPLDGQEFAGIDVVEARLARLRKGVKGRVDLRATSARWAWVEYILAQGAEPEGEALLEAHKAGGSFRAYKKAFDALPDSRRRRDLVRPVKRGDRGLPVLPG